jgi:tetratricopeptide (TPR) repeat protein
VLLVDGEFSKSLATIDEAANAAARTGNELLARRAAVARYSHTLYGSEESAPSAVIEADVKQAVELFESEGDLAGLTSALQLLAELHGTVGRYDEAAAAFLRVIAVAREQGDRGALLSGGVGYAVSSLHGLTPVAEAIRECETLKTTDMVGDRRGEAAVLGILGLLWAMAGDFTVGRELSERGRAMLVELGPSVLGLSTSIGSARIELLADDPKAAEALLSIDLASLEAIGERYFRSTIAGLHARAALALGDLDRATASAALARELADPEDTEAQSLWRSAEAQLMALRGSPKDAARLAEEAVQLASETVDLMLHADALVDLAAVMRTLGREGEAGPPILEALRLYERKGAVAAVLQVRRMLEASTAG